MRSRSYALLGSALVALGCSKPGVTREAKAEPAPTQAPLAPESAPSGGTKPAGPLTRPRPKELPAAARCSPDTPPDELSTTEFTQLYSSRVESLAVGTPPRAAIWSGTSAALFEREAARELPVPRLPPGASVEIFFGRDDQPRLMGFAPGEPGKEIPVYLRFRHGVFRPEPSELGPLGAPRGALYGVLGFADPEVVCRPRELCLVKRISGWKRVPAHDKPVRVVLRAGSVFALHADHIERLGADGWTKLEPERPFEQPLDVWPTPNGELWVADRSAAGLLRLKDGRWETVASPISEPRAIFGRSEQKLYVVGANGAAELDGARFRCLRGVSGPLHLALAVGDAIWLAGQSGVYAGRN